MGVFWKCRWNKSPTDTFGQRSPAVKWVLCVLVSRLARTPKTNSKNESDHFDGDQGWHRHAQRIPKMGSISLPSPQRLETILRRQDPPTWGPKYIPAMLATREEAPTKSSPSALPSIKLGRTLHAMSSPERDLLIYALYHPQIFDVHEQRMLACTPRAHPLDDHPEFGSRNRPFLRGTVQVAESLGILNLHPTVLWRDTNDHSQQSIRVPFPYAGDLLVFFHGVAGPTAVNWTVKRHQDDFDRPAFGSRKHKFSEKSAEGEKLRHEIEMLYYADGRIATVRLTPHDWSEGLRGNLRQLLLWHDRKVDVREAARRDIVSMFVSAVGTDATPFEVAILVSAQIGLSFTAVQTVMYQAIWRRELRVNLFETFMMDQPLLPELEDPIIKYSHWLREL